MVLGGLCCVFEVIDLNGFVFQFNAILIPMIAKTNIEILSSAFELVFQGWFNAKTSINLKPRF
jgi:hypothetical protein